MRTGAAIVRNGLLRFNERNGDFFANYATISPSQKLLFVRSFRSLGTATFVTYHPQLRQAHNFVQNKGLSTAFHWRRL